MALTKSTLLHDQAEADQLPVGTTIVYQAANGFWQHSGKVVLMDNGQKGVELILHGELESYSLSSVGTQPDQVHVWVSELLPDLDPEHLTKDYILLVMGGKIRRSVPVSSGR